MIGADGSSLTLLPELTKQHAKPKVCIRLSYYGDNTYTDF